MPLGVKLAGHRRVKSFSTSDAPPNNVPSSPVIIVNDQPPPPSILRSPRTHSSDISTPPSSLLNRLSIGDKMPRSDTTDSRWTIEGDRDDSSLTTTLSPLSSMPSTPMSPMSSRSPESSASSLTGMCPLPESSVSNNFPFFSMTLSSTSTLSFIALPVSLRPFVIDAVRKAWKRGIKGMDQVDYQPDLMKFHKSRGCDGGVWEITMKDNCWVPKSEDKVSSKRIILNLLAVFARNGYEMTSSYRMSSKDSGKDTLIFSHCDPDPDPVFFSVAFYSSDRVWIIDAEADVGQALEDGIKANWAEGIRDARVRERHCRELRLRGSPWTSHSHMALISARCIHLVILKNITHIGSGGYTYYGSVSMADLDANELPVCFYRKTGIGKGTWGTKPHLPPPIPVSDAAAKSMSIGR